MRRTFIDTMLIFRRYMTISLRNPTWVILGLAQPVLYLALFGPLLRGIAGVPGFPAGDAWQVFVPGLLVMLGLFGASFVGFSVITECRNGVIERMRVTPVSRVALLLGRVLRDVVTHLAQSVVLLTAAVAFGLRVPLAGVLISLGIMVLLTAGMAAFSYAAALVLKSEDAVAPLINAVNLPLLLLSGILLPLSLAPGWLETLSKFNPFRYVVEAMRESFLGRYTTGSLAAGLMVTVVLTALAIAAGTRTFRRENS